MKKQILFLLMAIIAGFSAANAQGFQRRTVEERVQMIHQKFDSAFKLDQTKLADADSAFANFFRSTDKLRDEMRNSGGGRPDFQAMKGKMEPIMEERDKKLKGILAEDQYKVWKDKMEHSMKPGGRRFGGGHGGRANS